MFEDILKSIEAGKRILITAHQNPDGDAIGSGLALMLAINKINKNGEKIVRFILEDTVPEYLMFLEHNFLIEKKENVDTKYGFDTAICVDCAELKRIGTVEEYIKEDTIIINIDHHISNTNFGNINFVGTDFSSTSEIVYKLIKEMNVEIDKDTAEAVYAGIVNDTGSFAYGNVSADTYLIAYELKKAGIDNEKIHKNIYGNKGRETLKILGKALDNFIFIKEKKLVYYYISFEEMKNIGAKKEDTEGIVENLRAFKETDISLFLREEENGMIKGSFRSKEADVNVLASLFGGGGHKKAAGFKTEKSVEEIINILKENIK